jgi:hypothetical protein
MVSFIVIFADCVGNDGTRAAEYIKCTAIAFLLFGA